MGWSQITAQAGLRACVEHLHHGPFRPIIAGGWRLLPEISSFLGIVIAMYYNDHGPAHFHARYGDRAVRIAIEDRRTLSGEFPRRARALVLEWLQLHRNEPREDWLLAKQRNPLMEISPQE